MIYTKNFVINKNSRDNLFAGFRGLESYDLKIKKTPVFPLRNPARLRMVGRKEPNVLKHNLEGTAKYLLSLC